MQLNSTQKRYLRGLAHALKPVVTIGGAGLNAGVLREIDLSLDHHELIKIKVNGCDRRQLAALADEICTQTGAGLAQLIGHTAVVYRASKQKKIRLPR